MIAQGFQDFARKARGQLAARGQLPLIQRRDRARHTIGRPLGMGDQVVDQRRRRDQLPILEMLGPASARANAQAAPARSAAGEHPQPRGR